MSIKDILSEEVLYSYSEHLNNYDKNRDVYDKLYRIAKYTSIISPEGEGDSKIIVFYDKNDKEICRSPYQIISVYLYDCKTLVWAWCMEMFKQSKRTGVKLLNYLIESGNSTLLAKEYMTSRLHVSDYMRMDMYDALIAMYVKLPFIYKHYYNSTDNKYIVGKKTNLEYRFILTLNIRTMLENYKE
jgi:hypothetical protein